MHPLLDPEKQVQAKQYEKENRMLGMAGKMLSLGVILIMYFSGYTNWLAGLFPNQSVVWTFLVYVVAFQLTLFIIGFPLSYFDGYVHEHKWKFSNHTLGSWTWEQIKSLVVGLGLMAILLGLLFWIMALSPHYWWLLAGLSMVLVGVIFATLFPVVILPIFNKYTPIEDEALTSALKKTLAQGGLKSSGFFKEDMSRQTKKENAFLAGLSKTRRVVLGDNLLNNMDVPEIESIIAHEVGHFKYHHIWKNILVGTLQQLLVFYLLHLLMSALFPEFLTSTRDNLALFPVFVIFIGILSSLLFTPLSHALSRYFERQADGYALENVSDPNAFVTALAGLANRNLANAYPEWWVKLLYYSHPPIGERLNMSKS